jgi:hypothetical protein
VRAEEARSAGHQDAFSAFVYERQSMSPACATNGSTTNAPTAV